MIDHDIQKDVIDSGYVELFVIDCTNLGGEVIRLTNMTPPPGQQTIVFGAMDYIPFPITASGFETKADGSQARPTLSISNLDKTVQSLVTQYGDLVGAKVTRLRTLEKYLDSGESPDPSQILPPDVYFIEQKTTQTREVITFQLCTALEKMAIKLPRRQVTRHGDSRYGAFPGAGRSRIR